MKQEKEVMLKKLEPLITALIILGVIVGIPILLRIVFQVPLVDGIAVITSGIYIIVLWVTFLCKRETWISDLLMIKEFNIPYLKYSWFRRIIGCVILFSTIAITCCILWVEHVVIG